MINPLALINDFLSQDNLRANLKSYTREELENWIGDTYSSTSDYRLNLTLSVDCLIAAGIGRKAEQGQTVYCSATGND